MPDAENGVGCEEGRSSPRAIRWGNRLRESCYRGERPACETVTGRRMEEDAARPRVKDGPWGKAARREAASLLATADRRMSKLRPGCVSAIPQSMRSRSKRQTHFDRLMEDGAQRAVRPRCPATEAINPSRQTGARRVKRSTPTRRTGVQRAKDQRQLRPAGLDRGRRATSNPPVRSALPAKDQRQTPLQQHSLLGDSTVMPVQQGDHAPRFLWRETLEKAKQ